MLRQVRGANPRQSIKDHFKVSTTRIILEYQATIVNPSPTTLCHRFLDRQLDTLLFDRCVRAIVQKVGREARKRQSSARPNVNVPCSYPRLHTETRGVAISVGELSCSEMPTTHWRQTRSRTGKSAFRIMPCDYRSAPTAVSPSIRHRLWTVRTLQIRPPAAVRRCGSQTACLCIYSRRHCSIPAD
jgi:hypothetical protein